MTAPGDVDQLVATDFLTGIGHKVETRTVRQGNQIGGNYSIGFLGGVTRPISVYTTEQEMETILQVRRLGTAAAYDAIALLTCRTGVVCRTICDPSV
jgi:hypothetical protein